MKRLHKITASIIISIFSTSIHAVDVRCLKIVNGKCVSVNDVMVNSTVDALLKIPETAGNILLGTNKSQTQNMPLKGSKNLHECMNGKNVIDDDVIRCRNGNTK
jgi:hypothetical protein